MVLFGAVMSKLGAKSMRDGEADVSCNGQAESPFGSREEESKQKVERRQIVWRNVILMALLHIGAVYSLLLIPKAHLYTLIWGKFLFFFSFSFKAFSSMRSGCLVFMQFFSCNSFRGVCSSGKFIRNGVPV